MGSRLRQLRENAELSQEALAVAVGTTSQQISRLERGDRRLTTTWMLRLAPHLGVAPAALLPGSGYLVYDQTEIALLNLWREMPDNERLGLLALLRRVATREATS